jgi:hypothetical protein
MSTILVQLKFRAAKSHNSASSVGQYYNQNCASQVQQNTGEQKATMKRKRRRQNLAIL